MSCNWLIGGAAVLLAANGIIRTAKQLPEVSRTAVWGRAALCMGGASCDLWGGNIETVTLHVGIIKLTADERR
jgi:hypothetical protein